MAHPKKSRKNLQGKKKSSSNVTNKLSTVSEKKEDNLAPLVRLLNNKNYF